ncbi:hypothetical protein B0H11DRAFT_1699993 [Mycena galericulata]|nr:hypothetical protein B0H11DRAFT_2237279 [Mycena galericulata]KAJ7512012.1 hypothetical protein B0H11DRAFT_1699993 [Mycena galericulata]
MSVLKIPLLLFVTLGIHATMTPPNPPPSQQEQLPARGLERVAPQWLPLILKVGRFGHLFVHASFWSWGLAEIAVLTARRISPSSALSMSILETLDISGGTGSLRMTRIFLLGCLLSLLGASIRLYCYHRLRTLFTFQLSIRQNHQLITTGLYSIVRHPSYTGAVLAGVGIGLCHLAPGSWLVECSGLVSPGEPWAYKIMPIWIVGLSIAVSALVSRIQKEDKMLHERFGKEWEAWVANVRYKIFPGVY